MNVIIIEDELLALKELERMLLQLYPDVEVVAHFDSVATAIDGLPNLEADLAFFDISLPDGHSFDILNAVEINMPIIFTTAYDEHAIKAFKYNSIDYLLKPVESDELRTAVEKFKKQKNKNNSPDFSAFTEFFSEKRAKKRFLIKTGEKYSYVNTREVAYFFAEDKITFIKTFAGKKHICDHSLNEIEEMVGRDFFRITRNLICSLEAIRSTSKFFNSRLKLELVPVFDKEVLVSRVKVKAFLDWMGG